MNDCISRHCIDLEGTSRIVSAWYAEAVVSRPYLMAEILCSAFGIDSESKDAQRLSPIIGRNLVSLGMTSKRMRGPQGNRHYWIK